MICFIKSNRKKEHRLFKQGSVFLFVYHLLIEIQVDRERSNEIDRTRSHPLWIY